MVTKICEAPGCTNQFETKLGAPDEKHFCCRKCANRRTLRPRITRTCAAPGCSNQFETKQGTTDEHFFCCREHGLIGRPSPLKGRTKETDPGAAKISKTLTGRKSLPESNKKRSATLKGRTYEDLFGIEKATKLRKIHREAVQGDKCNFWAGGIATDTKYSEDFSFIASKVRRRDRLQCCICGVKHTKLAVHHIDYNKMNDDVLNLITLCASCHCKTNYRRPFWKSFFEGQMRYLPFTAGAEYTRPQ